MVSYIAVISESSHLKRRGVTIFTADHIDGIRTDMDCRVMMYFLKCLALRNRVPSVKFSRAGGRPWRT
jgi:hypothetical protein